MTPRLIDQPPLATTADESRMTVVRGFLAARVNGGDVAEDEDLFATGYVNSLFALELITFLEGTFAITIEIEDLELESFRTINGIAALLRRKLGEP
jgi:methoxymalonate biosynthesis acyl carrier protein